MDHEEEHLVLSRSPGVAAWKAQADDICPSNRARKGRVSKRIDFMIVGSVSTDQHQPADRFRLRGRFRFADVPQHHPLSRNRRSMS